jgi:hypothetical protein
MTVSMLVCEMNKIKRFRKRSDLIGLDENGIGGPDGYALSDAMSVGYEKIVTDKHSALPEKRSELAPSPEILLVEPVLDGENGICRR